MHYLPQAAIQIMSINLRQALNQPVKKQSPKFKKFRKLWDQAEKLKKSNLKLAQRLKEISIEAAPVMEEVEKQLCDATHDLLDKKLQFFGRKSLALWQRQELLQWIEESVQILSYAEYSDKERLQQQLEQIYEPEVSALDGAAQYEDFEDPLDDWFGDSGDDDLVISIEEQLEHFEKDLKLGQAQYRADFIQQQELQQNDLFGPLDSLAEFDRMQAQELEAALKIFREQLASLDSEKEDSDFNRNEGLDTFEDFIFGYDDNPEQETQNNSVLRKLLDSANVKKIFQQLAKVLHPDREQDKHQQVIKHELMAKAIRARDEGDILSLFSMHKAHVQGSDLAFDDQQLDALCLLLAEQVSKLKQTKFDIIEDSPQQAHIHELFYASSPKSVKKKLDDYKSVMHLEIDYLNALVEDLTSLKKLKPLLEERYEENRFHNPFEMLNGIFGDRPDF